MRLVSFNWTLRLFSSEMALTVNGEIYNHLQIREALVARGFTFYTKSDCEVIIHGYEADGLKILDQISGIFSFVLYDPTLKNYLAARDPIGVNPLYQGWHKDGSVWFASEMKCLVGICERIINFPPGHYYTSEEGKHVPYYKPEWRLTKSIPTQRVDFVKLRESLVSCVKSQMMSEVPFGVLLSGGLDSSLIAAIAAKHMPANGHRLQSFCIGFSGSPDMVYAQQVADALGTEHHAFCITIEEAQDMLRDVIYHLETFDVTTIRASTPMFLLARHIKAYGVKMVLSGEGSDEIFGGYLYFHEAPNAAAFHEECLDRVENLHLADCLRANKSTMAWGLEVRVPFLDVDFLDVAMKIRPEDKMCTKEDGSARMEKHILRQAFDVQESGESYLPRQVLWRQKEQFSDGVGYTWIDTLKVFTESEVPNDRFQNAKDIFPHDTPTTKEAFYYRDIFERLFPSAACRSTVKRWIPRLDWGCKEDPSGRAQKVHTEGYQK
jgi:asparagine synthase (glutamine-hydrolysing)